MSIKALPRKTLFTSILLANALLGTSTYAGPQGGNITHGSGSIGAQGNVTNILQNSNQLIIDWNSFNVNLNETVNFNQPGASSVALNNILQYDASKINGQINANGQLILVNPRGLIFGSNAQINTAGLIVSSLSIAKEAFLNGEFAFKDLDDSQGIIVNNGAIHASSGGVTLLGESIINNGIIQADLGYINLAAGKQAYLSFDEEGFLGVQIDEDVINNELGLDQAIENNGELNAGGRVAISAKVTSELFDRAINNTGMIKATGFNLNGLTESPSITLTSNDDINNSGTLDASNNLSTSGSHSLAQINGGQVAIEGKQVIHTGSIDVNSEFGQGGKVDILGDQVGLAGGAIVNADGELGGGDIQIGGSYQGKDTDVKNAEATYVGKDTKISANAGTTGDGGDVVVWADKTTRYYGDIEAKGGSQSGNGGDVEVSGKQTLSFDGTVDSSAENGLSGELLLDPATLKVVADSQAESTNSSNLAGEVSFIEPITDATIRASTVVSLLSANNVKLTASNLIDVQSAIVSASTNTLELFSNGDIDVNALIQVGGALQLIADGSSQGATGTINIAANLDAESIQFTGNALTGNGAITVNSELDIAGINNAIGAGYTGAVTGTNPASNLTTGNVNNTFDVTGNATEFKINNATFTGFSSVDAGVTGTLNGTEGNDSFAITGNQSVLVNGTTFNQVTTVDAKDNLAETDVDSVSGSSIWDLTAAGFTANQISFFDFETADSGSAGTLNGTTGNDSFAITGNQSVLVNGTTFNKITTVDAKDNTAQTDIDSVTGSAAWDLTSAGFTANQISFVDFEAADSGSDGTVNGTEGDDSFTITGNQSILVNGTTFNKITKVDAKDNLAQTDIDSVSGGAAWDLTSAGFTANQISFVDFESADSGAAGTLNGTEGNENFEITGNQSVLVNGTKFTKITKVDAKDNLAQADIDSISGSAAWDLTAAGFTANEISFVDFETADSGLAGTLNGTEGNDSFAITGNQSILVNGTTFNKITKVDAKDNTAQTDIDSISGSSNWDLTSAGFTANQISFVDFEAADSGSDGTVNGTEGDDSFTITGNQSILVNGTTFNKITKVDAKDNLAQTDIDSVSGGAAWDLTSAGFTANQISFVDFESADSGAAGTLNGTEGNENFEITGNQSVLVNGTKFTKITKVDAKDNLAQADIDSISGSAAWDLTAAGFTANEISFVDFEAADSGSDGTVNGTEGDDSFTITGNQSILVNGTTFNQVTTVDAKDNLAETDVDSVSGSSIWDLTAAGFTANQISFFDFETADSGSAGTLNGTTGNDSFAITGNQSVLVNGTTFNKITTVDAKDNTAQTDIDSVTGSAAWDLTSAGFTANQISFVDFEAADSGSDGTVNGTEGDDSFTITGNQSILVNGTTFNKITKVDAKDNLAQTDIDSVSGGAAWDLTSAGFTANQISFVDFESADSGAAGTLNGTEGNENFEITGNQSVLVNGTKFTKITKVDAKDNLAQADIDSISGSAAWDLTAAGFTANEISFVDFETADSGLAGTLNGTEGNDSFAITGNQSILVNGTTFNKITKVDAKDNTAQTDIDSISGSSNWDLTAAGFTANQISFVNFESADSGATGTINGTDKTDKFIVDEVYDNKLEVNNTTFKNITTVNGGGGNDDVQRELANWNIQADNRTTLDGINYFSIETVNKFNTNNSNTRSITGTDSKDNFLIISVNAVKSKGITYYGIGTVYALDAGNAVDGVDIAENEDTVTGIAGQEWTLVRDNGSVNRFSGSGITFVDAEIADSLSAGSLIGTSRAEIFKTTATDHQLVFIDHQGASNNITFNNITRVDAAGNNHNRITSNDWLATDNSSVVSEVSETFVIESDGTITSRGVTFFNFEEMRGETNDSVQAPNSTLTYSLAFDDSDNSYRFAYNITTGTSSLIVDSDYQTVVDRDKVSFSGLETDGTETFLLEKVSGKYQISVLVGADTKVTSEQFLTLLSIDGIDSNDTFMFASTATLESAINFDANTGLFTSTLSGAASATAFSNFKIYDLSQLENDLAIGFTTSTASTFSLVGGLDNQLSFNGTEFHGFNNVTSTYAPIDGEPLNTITGSDQTDRFSGISGNSLTANGILFSNIGEVNAGGGADDIEQIQTAWAIQTSNNATSVGSIDFTGIDTINKDNSAGIANRKLIGTTGQDLLYVEGTNTIRANGITYYGIGSVDALGETDTVSGSSLWNLISTNSFEAKGISFLNTEVANSGAAGTLNGTANTDKFVVAVGATQSVAVNGTIFNQVSSVKAGSGNDDVQSDSVSWIIEGDKTTTVDGIAFSNVESVNKNNSAGITNRKLTGTAGKDALTIQADNAISAQGITYYGIGSVDALGETDTVSGSSLWNLISTNSFEVKGISFLNTEVANSGAGGQLNGTANTDKFVVAVGATQSVAVNGTTFNQVTSVNAGDGSDDVEYSSDNWTIQGLEASSIEGIAFTDVESINQFNSDALSDRKLTGTAGKDALTIQADNIISANGITYYGIGSVDALGETDTVSGSSLWNLISTNSFEAKGISFLNTEVANSGAAGTLNGTANTDKFVVAVGGTQSVVVNGTTFNQVTSVKAGDGNDDVEYSSDNWTIQGLEASSIEGIAFTDVESVNKNNSAGITNRQLTGTTGKDALTIQANNTISANGITYYGIGSVDALGETDTVSGSSLWNLISTNSFEVKGISFLNTEVANSGAAGTLNGTANTDKFVVAVGATQSVAVNGTTFNQVTSVKAGDGNDDVEYSSDNWTIQGLEASSIEGIAFTDVESVNKNNSAGITNRTLNGTAGQDLLNLESTNAISANGITYYGIGSVDALGETDTVSGSSLWNLISTNSFEVKGISFLNTEVANSGAGGQLNGTANTDKFVVAVGATQSVAVNGTTFNQVASVKAGDGNDDVEYSSDNWTIQGLEASSIEGIAFSDVESVNKNNSAGITNRQLTGTTGKDALTIQADNTISAQGITYYGIGSVDALGETDTVSGSSLWNLISTNSFEAKGISFLNTEVANSGAAGTLNGTANTDKFVVAVGATQSVAVNGTTFNQVTSVKAGDGNDDVEYSSDNWTIQGLEASSIEGIAFTDVESVNKNNSAGITNRQLTGTAGKDALTIQADNTISANGIIYYGIGSVDALGETDTVSGSSLWNLISTNSFEAKGISFLNTEVANSGAAGTLNGTANTDKFVVAVGGTQSVAVNGTTFNQVASVNAGNGSDDVEYSSDNWTIQGLEASSIEGIAFTDVESINKNNSAGITNRTLNGTAGQDLLNLESTNAISANGITYYGIGSVDALGETDTVSGSSLWNLISTNSFEAKGISFLNTEVANSGAAGTLNGTANTDKFVVAVGGTQSVVVNGTTFNQVTSVKAGDGNDDVEYSSDNWTIQGLEASSIEGIAFTDVESVNKNNSAGITNRQLTGTTGKDALTIQADNAISAQGITYYGIGSVDALGETDTVSGSSLWNLISTNSFEVKGISFLNTEVANSGAGGQLNGTANTDKFVVAVGATQSVAVNGTTFNQVTSVNAGDGSDDVEYSSDNWTIQGLEASSIEGIAFTDVESINQFNTKDNENKDITNRHLNGTAGQDLLNIESTNTISVNGITYYGIGSVDALGETDTVSGSSLWNLISTNSFEAKGINFVGVEVANSGAAGALNGNADANQFELIDTQSVSANGTTFNYVATVNANGGDNTLLGMTTADDFYLLANNDANKITSQQIKFNNIAFIDGREGDNRVHGTAGIDSFQLTEKSQQLITNDMTFDNIQTVLAGSDEDNLIGQNNQVWQVSNADNTIVVQGINFTQIENVTNAGIGSLIGSDQADQFNLVSANGRGIENTVMVNQLLFSNIETIDARANNQGEDVVISDIDQSWQLEEDSNFNANGILLSNIERATSTSSIVMGSIAEDIFETTDITNSVIANNVQFDHVTLLDGSDPGLVLSYSADLDAEKNNFNNADQVAAADKFIINSNNNIIITQGNGVDVFSQSGDQEGFNFEFKNLEVVDIVTTGDVSSTSGFEYLTVDAKNITINTSEEIIINDFNVTNDLLIASEGDLTFLNDVEFNSSDVNLSAENVSFRGGLTIASNEFAIDANKLNVGGDIDADVNAERTAAIDIGQDINLSIFNAIDIFVASEGSIYRKDEIDNADRLKRLLEETELDL